MLNKEDPFDKELLKLIENNELSVGYVEIKEPKNNFTYNVSLDSLSKSERAYLIKKKKFFKFNIK